MSGPISDSYWVEPGRLAAGEYPGARDPGEAAAKVKTVRAAGVTSFVDLTEEHELEPYESFLNGARRVRLPIRDGGVPTAERMREILDRIDAELASGEVVYVHCWGGHGRTGTVIGCWLVRHGIEANAALDRITELRRAAPDSWHSSPETEAQRKFVRGWIPLDPDALLVHAAQRAAIGLEERAQDHALGETKDLHPEMFAALGELVGDRAGKDKKILVPGWPKVGNVDLHVTEVPPTNGWSLVAEEKWDKLDEESWDMFKLALLATHTDVGAAFLVCGVSDKKLNGGFCADLVSDGRHSIEEICLRPYPRSNWLLWEGMLHGGHDNYPESVPSEIETRVIARLHIPSASSELRVVRVLPAEETEDVPFVGGWPHGKRPQGVRHPKLAPDDLEMDPGPSSLFTQALSRTVEIHGDQKRKGTDIPYVSHLLSVCGLVLQDGGDETEAIAALLHDAAEDQGGKVMLTQIEAEFGPDVARIVAECSDTFKRPKPPWRERKEHYLAHLPEASPSALHVSVADKLDNARAILADYRRLGPELWMRFDPESDQLWYYRSLVDTYRNIEGFSSPLLDELDRVVSDLENLAAEPIDAGRSE